MTKRPLFFAGIFAIYLTLSGNAPADDLTEWQKVRGKTFQGTAVEALGPLAVCRTKKRDRPILMPFRLLGVEGAKKFHAIVGGSASRGKMVRSPGLPERQRLFPLGQDDPATGNSPEDS
jgi:hypothetical protein